MTLKMPAMSQFKTSRSTAPRTRPIRRFVVYCLLSLGLYMAYLSVRFPEHFREYRLYLTEQRPALDFSFDELSEDWSEADLRRRFSDVPATCYAGMPEGTPEGKACYLDISAYNGAPALGAVFFFVNDRLSKANVNLPWWGHDTVKREIVHAYGAPYAEQDEPVDGLRLQGWKLGNGSALFLNRDRELNPVMWSSVYWSSRRLCVRTGCFLGEAKRRP